MKITKSYLQQVIKEELERLDEGWMQTLGSKIDKGVSNVGSSISKIKTGAAQGIRTALGSTETKDKQQLKSVFSNLTKIDKHIKEFPLETFDDINLIMNDINQLAKQINLQEGFFGDTAAKVERGLKNTRDKLGGQENQIQIIKNAVQAYLQQLNKNYEQAKKLPEQQAAHNMNLYVSQFTSGIMNKIKSLM